MPMLHSKTKVIDTRVADRWRDRNGGTNPPRRSGRFTKPGAHPRAATKEQAKQFRDLHDRLDRFVGMPNTPATQAELRQSVSDYLDQERASRGRRYFIPQSPVTSGYLRTLDDRYTPPDYQVWINGRQARPVRRTNAGTDYWGVSIANNTLYLDNTSAMTTSSATITVSSGLTTGTPLTGDTGQWIWIDEAAHYDATFKLPELTPEQKRDNARVQLRMRYQRQLEVMERRPDGVLSRVHVQRAATDFTQVNGAEAVALTLLRQQLEPDEWRRYLKYGFVLVQSPTTGLEYQIYRKGHHILVRRLGKLVAELCIHLANSWKMPPTDQVVALRLMLHLDEAGVWRDANIHSCTLGYNDRPTIDLLRGLAPPPGVQF